jgi:hypothetical protein
MTTGLSTVELKNFDKGLVYTTFMSELVDLSVDGGTKKAYAKEVPGLSTNVPGYDGNVPVFFAFPESVYQPFKLPCFVFRRTGLTPAFERQPWYGYQRTHADDANELIVKNPTGTGYVTGYDKYKKLWSAFPFNIAYDVQVMARRQNTGLLMLAEALRIFRPPFFTAGVYDSSGDLRQYDAGEVTVSSANELADVEDRTIAWTISFEIRGELNLVAEETQSLGDEDGGIVVDFPVVKTEIKE